jgi:hypothetical protein
MKYSVNFAAVLLFTIILTNCQNTGGKMKNTKIITLSQDGKAADGTNPLITQLYCADPTAVEYEGRLYVYGTNDHQQYLYNIDGKNTYEKIKSLVVISTDDMVNWTYHGLIDVGRIAPWIIASWAPSVVSRVEEDRKTHFYLYFSNSGAGTGVLTAASPAGPWSDPLGRPLVDGNMKGAGKTSPFDPGVVIDDDGAGWLSFGGSFNKDNSRDEDDANYMPGGARIVKLGGDMISLASEIIEIPVPYHFEANELNYINGTYIYTYNTNWEKRNKWELEGKAPPVCSISYMTSKTPLDPKSWVYRGHYFLNPGENAMDYCNNHTHLHKYNDQYYLFYHTTELQKKYGVKGGFRNICVDEAQMDENTLQIPNVRPTAKGIPQIKNVDAFANNSFSTFCVCAGVNFEAAGENRKFYINSEKSGSWILVRNVDFSKGARTISIRALGKGGIEIRLDKIDNPAAAYYTALNLKEVSKKLNETITGIHDLFFIFDGNINADTWKFGK